LSSGLTGPTIRSRLTAPYDLLEQNLLCIVEPYSVSEIESVAWQDVEASVLFPFR
jgi:hypothetical protein